MVLGRCFWVGVFLFQPCSGQGSMAEGATRDNIKLCFVFGPCFPTSRGVMCWLGAAPASNRCREGATRAGSMNVSDAPGRGAGARRMSF